MEKTIDLNLLDKIINDTLDHLEKGKKQITDIADSARQERNTFQDELVRIRRDALEAIEEVDRLEDEETKARLYLMKVSREFERYTEKDVKEAYDMARDIQLKLGLFRERESQLRTRRDQIEISLRRLNQTVEKAEDLVASVGVALEYLVSSLKGLGLKVEDLMQRQQLTMRIIKAQEEERKRVAREIHDGPAQSMANLVLRVEICEKLLGRDPKAVKAELADLKAMVKDSLNDVRKIIFDLRPMVLDDLGIVPALKRYISEFQKRCDLVIDLQVLGGVQKRLGSTLEIAIFRIIQEALNNVFKHAQTDRATVFIEQSRDFINLRIQDDGRGFDQEKVLGNVDSDSYGLIGIRERVELLEGKFKLNTAPRRGTNLRIQIPIEEKKGVEGPGRDNYPNRG